MASLVVSGDLTNPIRLYDHDVVCHVSARVCLLQSLQIVFLLCCFKVSSFFKVCVCVCVLVVPPDYLMASCC